MASHLAAGHSQSAELSTGRPELLGCARQRSDTVEMWKLLLAGVLGFVALAVVSRMDEPPLMGALGAGGCVAPVVEHERAGGGLLRVAISHCTGSRGELEASDRALLTSAAIAWATPAHRFEHLRVTVYRVAESPAFTRAASRVFGRAELESRFGPRPPSLDQGQTFREWFDSMSWIGLLAGLIGALALPIWLGVMSARSGVHVFWVRR